MTISSVLVGYATGDQRQIPSAEGPAAAPSDADTALLAGSWSAIDWEFGSVLRALIPDVKEEPVKVQGASDEQTDSSAPVALPVPTSQTIISLTSVYPAAFSLPFDRDSLQPAVAEAVQADPAPPSVIAPTAIRVVPRTEGLNTVAVPLTAVIAASEMVPASVVASVAAKTLAPETIARPVEPSAPEGEAVRVIPRRIVPIAPKSLPTALSPGSRLESPSKDSQANTLDAEIVSAPAARISDSVATTPPSDPRVESPKPLESNAPIQTHDMVPAQLPVTLPESRLENPESNPVPEKASVGVQLEPRPSSAIQNAPEVPKVPTTSAPTEDRVTIFRVDALPIAPTETAAPSVPKVAVERTAETSKVRVNVEPNQAPVNPECETDSPENKLVRTIELPIATPQVIETAGKPVEAAETKIADTVPNLTIVADDQPAPETSNEEPAPAPIANATAPILHSPVPLPLAPRVTDPERRADDKPKPVATGLIVVQDSKPERSPESPELPTASAGRNSTDLGQLAVADVKTKSDQLTPADTEVAFTGRLVPRKTAEETSSRPEPSRPVERLTQSDPIEIGATRETPGAPVERPGRPLAEVRAEPNIVASTIHREAAPAANRPAEAPPAPRSANTEMIHEPVTRETPGPVREISMRFNDTAQESAHLRVVEKGGEVLVSVRSGSEQLARTLSSDLGDLTHRLEQTGFQAELYRPAAQSSSNDPGHDRRDNSPTPDQNGNSSWSRERRDSQQNPGQKSREWIDDLEESMGLSQ